MELRDHKEIDKLTEKIQKLKNLPTENFNIGNYVDAIDETKVWCLGQIVDKNNDFVKVRFEGWSSRFDETIHIKKLNKINFFRRYSKGYTGQKKVAFREYEFKENDLIDIIDSLKTLVKNNFSGLDPLDITQIIRGKIFTFVDIFMTLNYRDNPRRVSSVVELIYTFLDFTVAFLRFYLKNIEITEILEKHPDLFLIDEKCAVLASSYEIFLTVKRIFGRDERVNSFFKSNEEILLILPQRAQVNILDEKSLAMNTIYKDIIYSVTAGKFINYFEEREGFILLKQIILKKTGESFALPLNFLDTFLKYYPLIQPLISTRKTFFNDICEFYNVISHRIENLTENEIKEIQKSSIISIAKSFQILFSEDQDKANQCFEQIIFMFNFKSFSSNNLERRIKGITSINSILEQIERKERGLDIKMQDEQEVEFLWMSSKMILTLLKDKNTLDIILGELIHEEILKRAAPIFKLFARAQKLERKYLDTLLSHRSEKHESILQHIENIICEITDFLNEEDKLYIFEKIKEIPIEKADIKFLTFIKNFSLNCLFSSGANGIVENPNFENINLYGIPVFWRILQDDKSNKNPILIDNCAQFLYELISDNNTHPIVFQKYVYLCIENIKNNLSIVQSINLFKRLIEKVSSYSVKMRDNDSIEEVFLKNLDKKENFLKIIVDDTTRYMKFTREYIATEKIDSSSSEILNMTFEGHYPHRVNIESRLNIIYIILTEIKQKEQIDYSFLDELWQNFVIECNNENESNQLYKFLMRRSETNESEDVFSHSIAEYLYINLLTNKEKNNFSTMVPYTYMLFYKYFRIINDRSHKILVIKNNYFKVISDEVLGFDAIWDMLISTKNDTIINKIAKLLVDLCLNVNTLDENYLNSYWNNYFNKLFIKLNECNENANEYGMKAILTLIKLLLKTLKEGGEIPSNEDINFIQNGLSYMFIFAQKDQKREMKVAFTDTVFTVRQKLAYFFDICLDNLVLKIGDKTIDFTHDLTIFKELSEESDIDVFDLHNPILNLPLNPHARIVEDNKFFHVIFDLLHNSNSTYIDAAWELINLLPKNKELEGIIKSFGENTLDIEWEKIIDSKSIFKMHYTLNIIKSFAFVEYVENENQESKETQCQHWIKYFVNNGGLTYLKNLIFNFEPEHFDNFVTFSCFKDILSIISKCQNLEGNSNDFKNVSQLFEKLLTIILAIFKSSSKRDEDKKFIAMQSVFNRQRQKALIQRMMSNSSVEEDSQDDGIHQTIKENWNIEDTTLNMILNYISENFKIENVIESFENCSTLNELLQFGLIKPKNFKIKMSIFQFFCLIMAYKEYAPVEIVTGYIFKILLDRNTLNLAIAHSSNTESYFKILLYFLNKSNLQTLIFENSGANLVNIESLTDFLVDYIKNFNAEDENQSENVFIGFLNILRIFAMNSELLTQYLLKKHEILRILLNECLISKCNYDQNSKLPKCKNNRSKDAAYKLLSAFAYKNPEIILNIINIFTTFHSLGFWRARGFNDWTISPVLEEKSSTGYVGIKNLGCICYMNSLMQQFFMIKPFRENLLQSANENIQIQEESVLFQMKKIFAFLKSSDRQYHNPRDFCSNFKNWDMQPINVFEQMDVDEFANLLIDRLENCMKGTKHENIFKYYFAGKLTNELICKGCPHYSEREETYFNLSLQVKNKKSLLESLETFVAGEMLEGANAYFCEKCAKKVNTLRRVCIKELPRYLIIVLKRFEFDFDTMQKIKVNDYCSFPNELNMEPYTQDYLMRMEKEKDLNDAVPESNSSENNYKYNLSGVIIHTGFSDSGHYYSLIKENNKNNWIEFNDTHVRPYDQNDLPNEAFGGTYTGKNQQVNEKMSNAYVLFYKREVDIGEEDSTNNHFQHDDEMKIDDENRFQNIQSEILEKIKSDNYHYWVSKVIFSNPYFEFVEDILLNYNNEFSNNYFRNNWLRNANLDRFPFNRKLYQYSNINENAFVNSKTDAEIETQKKNLLNSEKFENRIFIFGCYVFFTTILRYKEKNSIIPSFLDILKGYINKSNINANWILEEFSSEDNINEFLIECPKFDNKRFICGLLYCAMLKITQNEVNFTDTKNPIVNFINTIILIIKNKYRSGRDLTFIYSLLWRASTLNRSVRKYLISTKLSTFLILYYLQKYNSLPAVLKVIQSSGIKININSIEDNVNIFRREPEHQDLSTKKQPKLDKLTPFEEFAERKILEKLEKLYPPSDYYLLMTLSEILGEDNLLNETPKEERLLLSNITDFYMIVFNEVKSKQITASVSKLIKAVSFNNKKLSDSLLDTMINLIDNQDAKDLDYVMKIFSKFLIINDTLKNDRIYESLNKFFAVIFENSRFYKFFDFSIDFTIKLFINNFNYFLPYIKNYREYLEKIIEWIQENPYAPIYYPSKTTVMFKNTNYQYQNTNYNQSNINNYINKWTLNSNEKILKLNLIMQENENELRKYMTDDIVDRDLTDFKFSVNDKVKIDNNVGKVVCVLDEMVKIEYTEFYQNIKKTVCDWFDCGYKNLTILELYEEKNENGTDEDLY